MLALTSPLTAPRDPRSIGSLFGQFEAEVVDVFALLEESGGVVLPGNPYSLAAELVEEALTIDSRCMLAHDVQRARQIESAPATRRRCLVETVAEWLAVDRGAALPMSPAALARTLCEAIERGER